MNQNMPERYRLLKFSSISLIIIIISVFSRNSNCNAQTVDNYISTAGTSTDFPIVNGTAADIYVGSNDFWGVVRAVNDLQADIKRVTGVTPAIKNEPSGLSSNAIIVGTIGKSTVIDNLISSGKIDVTGIQGKWESAVVQVVDNPFAGVSKGLVIAGSDRRGTIYGIYDLTEKMGVSPWYWWADVPVKNKNTVFVKKGIYKQGEPSVKYRGIFINDEAPCLSGWTKEKFGGVGFNHHFYELVFELLLRLKANYLWPAMWGNAFNEDDTLNPVLAEKYGIVMGTSHHEPMMRAQKEWTNAKLGEWNYVTNKTNLYNFWDYGINRNKAYDNLVTIGMRGDGDKPMPGNTLEEKMDVLRSVIADQRKILANRINSDLTKIPQIWALYTEVQEFYENGFRVPEDVTHLWTDDNYGNVRRLPTPDERNRAGGAGIYYHVDANVSPYIFKWINTMPITKIWEQMNMAWEHDARRVWIVNVGDIKPLEFPMDFFLRMAWNVNTFKKDNLTDYVVSWATEQFGSAYASDIADIIMKYSKYNGRRKPEIIIPTTYNVTNYNEGERVLNEWNSVADKCEQLYSLIPAQYKDAFFQLVYYPAVQSKRVMEMQYYSGLNELYYNQGRAMTNDYADRTKATYNADSMTSYYYNHVMLDGKWNHIMDQAHIGHPGAPWEAPQTDSMPKVRRNSLSSGSEMGVAIEGSTTTWPNSAACRLPDFSIYTKNQHFIEIFNKKSGSFNFTITSNNSWIKVSTTQGTVQKQARVWVGIDWNAVPIGANVTGALTVSGGTTGSVTVNVNVVNPVSPSPKSLVGFIESNGYISMEADHFTRKVDVNGVRWERVPDYGRTGSSMAIFPSTAESVTPPSNSPCLEYQFYLFNSGTFTVSTYTTPTCAFNPEHGIRYAVSIDNQTPQTIQNYPTGNSVKASGFNNAVKDNILIKSSSHTINSSGYHTLKFWMVDPGIALQKIVINTGGLQTTYLGPPESYFGTKISPPVSSRIQCETMTLGGSNANTVTSPFKGIALYAASGDYYSNMYSFTSSEDYTLSVCGTSGSKNTAKVSIYLNGLRKGEFTFTGTTPSVKSTIITASACNQEIKLVNESGLGGSNVYLDYYQLDAISSSVGTTYEAENGTTLTSCIVENNYSGYAGTGYVNFNTSSTPQSLFTPSNLNIGSSRSLLSQSQSSYGVAGAAIEWSKINCSTTGTKNLKFRYALASGIHYLDVYVNGIQVTSNAAFKATGSWSTWGESTIQVSMNSGTNTLKVVTTGTKGPAIDNVNVTGAQSAVLSKLVNTNTDMPITDNKAVTQRSDNGTADTLKKVTSVMQETTINNVTVSGTQNWTYYGLTIQNSATILTPDVQNGEYYKVVNVNSGKVLAIKDMSTADSGTAIQWTDNGTVEHTWKIESLFNGFYKMTNKNGGKVLSVKSMSLYDSAQVLQRTENGTADQEWKFEDMGNDQYRITNINSGKVLGVSGASTNDDAEVVQSTDNGGNDQRWMLVKL